MKSSAVFFFVSQAFVGNRERVCTNDYYLFFKEILNTDSETIDKLWKKTVTLKIVHFNVLALWAHNTYPIVKIHGP